MDFLLRGRGAGRPAAPPPVEKACVRGGTQQFGDAAWSPIPRIRRPVRPCFCERAFVVKQNASVRNSEDELRPSPGREMTRTTLLNRGSRVSFARTSDSKSCFCCVCCSRSSAWGSSVSEKPRTEAGRIRNKRGTDRSKRHARPGAPASGDDGEEGKVE